MTKAIYPGSFDPITKGHLDVLETGAEIFDKVIIAVAKNSAKHGFLTIEERVELIKKSCAHLKNVEVDCFDGLTAEYAKTRGATVLLRGLRNSIDFEYEIQLAQANCSLNDTLDTISLFTKPEHSFISSSMVREILKNGGNVKNYVPENVFKYLVTYGV